MRVLKGLGVCKKTNRIWILRVNHEYLLEYFHKVIDENTTGSKVNQQTSDDYDYIHSTIFLIEVMNNTSLVSEFVCYLDCKLILFNNK